MTYVINITGHTDDPDEELSAKVLAAGLVTQLPDVTSAHFSGMHGNSGDLRQRPGAGTRDDEPAPPPPGQGTPGGVGIGSGNASGGGGAGGEGGG